MNTSSDQSVAHSLRVGEALFALGLALPLFAGGNTLAALEPKTAIKVFAAVTILVCWQILRSTEANKTPVPRPILIANACLVVLASWWIANLVARPSGPRAFLEAQGILCAILLFATLSQRRLEPYATARFVRGLLLGTMGSVAFGQYQYWVAFPRTIPLAHAAGIPAFGLVNANFYSANCYAIFLAGIILVVIGLAISNRNAWAWMAVPLLVVTIVLTGSRAAIALLAIGGVGLGAITGWWPNVAPKGVTTLLFWVLLPAAAGAAAASVDLGELWHVATVGRIAIWRGSLNIVRQHWLAGVGLGRFGEAFSQFRVNDYHTLYPHCFLLEVAAELGVIGLFALIAFVVAAFMGPIDRLFAAARSPYGCIDALPVAMCAASAVLLVHGLGDIDWHAPANPILLFVLLGALQRLPMLAGESRGR
jgi:O-antigen ligase